MPLGREDPSKTDPIPETPPEARFQLVAPEGGRFPVNSEMSREFPAFRTIRGEIA